MSKARSNQSTNYLLMEERKQKIQKHSLTIHKQFMMFMKIWKTIIQQRKGESR